MDYVTKQESDYLHEHSTDAYRVMVAGHELFGHGSGKLIYKDQSTGKCPMTFEDPLDKSKKLSTCYDKGQTYDNTFGEFSASYEECRADLSGLFLTTFEDVYKVFDYKKEDVKNLLWLNAMEEIRKGTLAQ